MKTVNSLSGGKTSSYLAIHHPSDYNLFSLVCNDDPKCAHKDKKLMQIANDKLSKYCSQFGEFIGTPEHPSIIKIMLDLEQMMGSEIIWLRGISFDQAIKKHSGLVPNQMIRYCTTEMKLNPIFWFWYLYVSDPVKMRVGFRYDEKHRASNFTTNYRIPIKSNTFGKRRQSWVDFEDWRIPEFPLIEEKVNHFTVSKFWNNKDIIFPEDSNCQHCFWKPAQQIRQNAETTPNIINWASKMEKENIGTFKKEMSMDQLKNIGLQLDFLGGQGMYCNSGGCTD